MFNSKPRQGVNLTNLRPPRAYLPQLLAFIFADEVCNNYFLSIIPELPGNLKIEQIGFILFFFLVQIIFSPIQSGYSDFYCRKRSLIISLGFSALSVVPAFLYFEHVLSPLFLLCLMIIIKGVAGNNLPLAWAGIADTQTKNVRLSLGFSTSAIALGYLGLIILRKIFNETTLSVIIFFMFLFLCIICYKSFIDIRDNKTSKNNSEDPSLISDIKTLVNKFLRSRRFTQGLLTYLFWEISFYSAHMLDVDLKIIEFKGLTLAMILGYLFGVACLWKLPKKSDEEVIKLGYQISILSFVPMFSLYSFVPSKEFLIIICYFSYAFGAAFLAPSLFSTLSKEREPHEQGKIYGLLDSTDTIALLVSTIITMTYNWLNLNQIVIVFISFTLFLLSWWPYASFKKTRSASK